MKIFNKKIFALFILLLASCADKANDTPTESETVSILDQVNLTEAQLNLVGLKVGKIESRKISNTIKANGMLDVPPQNLVTVSAMLGGFVKQTDLLQGMQVKKGQVIAVMEDPAYIQLQQEYLENKSQLDFNEMEYKRQQELAKENINAQKTVQQAQSNFLSAKAKVEGLKSKLKMINISFADLESGNIKSEVNLYSPISGYVTQVHVNLGMYVNSRDIMFKIVDTKHLHAEIIVYEKDVLNIKIDQRVRFQLANETKERIAHVYLVGKEISPDRTVRVHCHLEKEDISLLPGMYLSAFFETSGGSVPSLPELAVINFEGADYVFLVISEAERIYKMIKVTKGITESGYSEITLPQGIDPTSLFVVEGAYDLLAFLKNTEEE